jgi:hypothetical protein
MRIIFDTLQQSEYSIVSYRLCLVRWQSYSWMAVTWKICVLGFWQSCFVVSEQVTTVRMSMNFELICRLCLTSGKPLLPLFDKHQTLPSKIKAFAPCLKVSFFIFYSLSPNRRCVSEIVKCWIPATERLSVFVEDVIWGLYALTMDVTFYGMRHCSVVDGNRTRGKVRL